MIRRRFLGVLAGGAAVLAFPFRRRAHARASALGVMPGTPLDGGRWTIVEIRPVGGGIAVVMESAGERFQVDVLARSTTTPGVANTHALSLYLCNQGRGVTASREEHGLGALALARALDGLPAPSLLTLEERNRRFPGGAFAVA